MDDQQHPLARFTTPERVQRIRDVLSRRLQTVTVVTEDLCDRHNVAAVMRSAEAFGIQDVHVVERGSRVLGKCTESMGANQWLTVHWHDRLAACIGDLQARGFEVWGADVAPGAVSLTEITCQRPTAVVLGSERVGLSRVARLHVDHRFFIPMEGFTASLNVSVAAAIALRQVTQRRRQQLGVAGDLELSRQAELTDKWLRSSVRRGDALLKELERRG